MSKGRGLMPPEWYRDASQQIVGHCKAPGCGVPMVSEQRFRNHKTWFRNQGIDAHRGFGLCSVHHARFMRTGTTEKVGPKRSEVDTAEKAIATAKRCGQCAQPMIYADYVRRFPELLERGFVRVGGRGLCKTCYSHAQRTGQFGDDVRGRSAEEVLEDWEMLRDDGESLENAARRMGMTVKALDKALYRARKKGDPRGSLYPFGNRPRRTAA